MDKTGVIYILTNPSFPEYVKIGYADDIDKRLQRLNRSECIPFAFRVYATYEVNSRLSDLKIHKIAVCTDSGCACYSLKSQFSPSQRRSFSPPKSVLYGKKIGGRRAFLWHSNGYLPGFTRGTTEKAHLRCPGSKGYRHGRVHRGLQGCQLCQRRQRALLPHSVHLLLRAGRSRWCAAG